MSADIWLETMGGETITVSYDPDAQMRDLIPMRYGGSVTATSFNLTYNLSPMLRRAGMPPWSDLVGLPTSAAGPIWRKVHANLVANPVEFRALNPDNGWGTYEQAVEVIGALADACAQHPQAKVGGWL